MKPGPSKGSGGRPRKLRGSNVAGKLGYRRVTTGPPSKGTQKLEHRVVAGAGKGSKTGGTVVHHVDHNKVNNAKKNLKKLSRRVHPKVH